MLPPELLQILQNQTRPWQIIPVGEEQKDVTAVSPTAGL